MLAFKFKFLEALCNYVLEDFGKSYYDEKIDSIFFSFFIVWCFTMYMHNNIPTKAEYTIAY